MQLAGTSWRAVDTSLDSPERFAELQFGTALTPEGMGQVRVAPDRIVLFQVVDGKLILRDAVLGSRNRPYDYVVSGNRLTLTAVTGDGKRRATQRFARVAPRPSPAR
jgi:hypothetical protein